MVREQVELLKHHSDLLSYFIDIHALVRQIDAFKQDLSGSRYLKQI